MKKVFKKLFNINIYICFKKKKNKQKYSKKRKFDEKENFCENYKKIFINKNINSILVISHLLYII